MWLDPKVARIKFEKEVDKLLSHKEHFRLRGCIIENSTYPQVKAIILPQRPVPLKLNTGKLNITMPAKRLSYRSFGVRIDMAGYDIKPPSVTFHNPLSWEYLSFEETPLAYTANPSLDKNRILRNQDILRQRPFLCMEGIREFHIHPQHNNIDWFSRRKRHSLFDLLSTIITLTCSVVPIP